MGQKELLNVMKVSTWLAPVATTTWTADIAAVVNVDTLGYESTMFIVSTGEMGATDVIIQMWDSAASGAEGASGAAVCVPEDVEFAVESNTAANLAEYVTVAAASQTLTLAAANSDNRCFIFAYHGNKRYVRLHITSAGSVAGIAGILVIQDNAKRAPYHTTK